MPEEVPLGNRAWVIVSYDKRFIGRLGNVPPNAEKVYYRGIALKAPEWRELRNTAVQLAQATGPEIAEQLDCTRVHEFTSELEEAMRFERNEIDEELRAIQSQLKTRLKPEMLNEEYLPF